MEVIAMQLYWQAYNGDTTQTIYQGGALEVLRSLPSESVHCCVTSPPYWGLRDYGVEGQLGLESTPEEYVSKMVEIFREVKRVLRNDGTLWLNLGDCYNGSGGAGGDYNKGGLKEGQPKYPGRKIARLKPKDLVGIPWRVALALQADGWYLRSDIIWHKPNAMPESVKDRCTKAHEYIFLLSKSKKYYYDADAIREPLSAHRAKQAGQKVEPGNRQRGSEGHFDGHKWFMNPLGRNKRSVWTVPTQPFPEAHFAVYPPALITPCILAGCPVGGTVLDPFAGSGTTLLVAQRLGRSGIGIELNPDYCAMASRRIDRGQ
jgi:DNA modification methylase